MKKYKIFIDGEAGTTGLQIRERLRHHPDIEVVSIGHEKRRDIDAKHKVMQGVDIAVLCLPDEAAREAATLAQDVGCRLLDASSAHRVIDGWVYGLPELCPEQRIAILNAAKVANPGCYSTGAILLLRPLIDQQLLPIDGAYPITAISGYTGGGNHLIKRYEEGFASPPSFATYGLGFNHKHIPEIQKWSHLATTPLFIPSVGNFKQGMLVFIQLNNLAEGTAMQIYEKLQCRYECEPFISVQPYNDIPSEPLPFLTPHGLEGSNRVELSVFGTSNGSKALLVAKLDNLGKGASGAAVQNLNLMLGLEENTATNLT